MYVCNSCGTESLKWQGQCPNCREWNTLVEFKEVKEKKWSIWGIKKELHSLQHQEHQEKRILTASEELNSVLWGGIVSGSIILLSGEPGIGKSTLSLQISWWLQDKHVLYVSGEETVSQISSRAKRLWVNGNNISLLAESNFDDIEKSIEWKKLDLIIIDSVSVMHSDNASGTSGSINQIKYIGEKLQSYAKSHNTSIILIGHITKDGAVAGPKSLEHLVDVVLFFEGERYDEIRLLRSLKNRFGSTGDIGIFKMTEEWLADIHNPGLELINDKNLSETIGSSLSITVEWNRPLLVECEALTTYTKFGYPKRSTRGINTSKLDMIIAVLSKYSKVKLESYDVYANIARGLRLDDPAIDLSIAASIISSKGEKKLKKDTVYLWEISLTGNIKTVVQLEKRIKEAEKLGFTRCIIPDVEVKKWKIELVKVKNISEFVEKI